MSQCGLVLAEGFGLDLPCLFNGDYLDGSLSVLYRMFSIECVLYRMCSLQRRLLGRVSLRRCLGVV